eukprot:UN10079
MKSYANFEVILNQEVQQMKRKSRAIKNFPRNNTSV